MFWTRKCRICCLILLVSVWRVDYKWIASVKVAVKRQIQSRAILTMVHSACGIAGIDILGKVDKRRLDERMRGNDLYVHAEEVTIGRLVSSRSLTKLMSEIARKDKNTRTVTQILPCSRHHHPSRFHRGAFQTA